MDYVSIILCKYPAAIAFPDSDWNFEIENGPLPGDLTGPFKTRITLWNLPDPQPTIAELEAYAASPEYRAAALAQAKTVASEAVNAQAAAERAKYRTPYMAETYTQKQRDVDTWKGGGKLVTDIPYAARRAARRNGIPRDELDRLTHAQLQEAIDEYEAAIAALRVVDLDIEDVREQAKEAIKAAATVEEVEAIVAGLSWPIVPE